MPQNELLYAPAMTKMSWQNAFTTVSSWLITDGVNLSVNNINSQLVLNNPPSVRCVTALPCLWSPYVIGQTIYIFMLWFVMVALWNRPDHYVFALWLLLLFFSSPNLSRRRLDVCHTSIHGVALVRISDAGLKPAARGSLKTQDAKKSPKIAIWAPSHNFVGLYLRN